MLTRSGRGPEGGDLLLRHPQAGVRVRRGDEQPAPGSVFRAPAGADGRALKKQVIGYGESTMAEIVEAYVNPDLPPEEWDLAQLVGKVKGSSISLKTSPSSRCRAWPGGTQGVPAGATAHAYDLKEGQSSSNGQGSCVRRSAFILQQVDTLWREHLQAMDALRGQSPAGYGQRIL